MVRIPDQGRFEIRLMDGATNPYLLQAAVIAAGLDGITNKRDPGKRIDLNMYTEQHKLTKVRKLPANLLDAIRLLDASQVARTAFGDEFIDSYVKLKNEEWKRFTRTVTPWERDHTLDC
jgi:glutamine synthetase